MKKLLLIICLSVFTISAIAQDSFSLGPKIGYNSNTLTDNIDSISGALNNSFQVGAFIRLGGKVYFQPEADYQLIKGNLTRSNGASTLRQDISIQSLKIPALIGIKLINKSTVNLRVMAGPAFTFLFNKKLDPSVINELWPIQSVEDFKNSIWSVQMGAGLDVLFMTLDVRYELGIDNMYNGSSDLKLKNNVFNVSLGIKLL